MGITQLPIEPYWVNAAEWWLANRNTDNNEFNCWLYSQGLFAVHRESFYPWIEFSNPKQALLFQLRWS